MSVEDPLTCSFCGKSQFMVRKLIAGPAVHICDECVLLCDDIIADMRSTNDAEERAKLTPKLRYEILNRDGRRCVCCGASVATGAILHVDHIRPISLGGLTIKVNLQTLCSGCNHGKAASFSGRETTF